MSRLSLAATVLAALVWGLVPGFGQSGQEPSGDWQAQEARILKNIRQVTRVEMGLDKSGEAYFSPDGTRIAFQAYPKGEEAYQIYTMPLAGGRPKMVSPGKGHCTCVYFHPKGEKILFASTHLNPELGEAGRQEGQSGYQRESGGYAWVFHRWMNIFEADLDGSNLKPLTNGPSYDAEGAWGWDGRQIVFASNRTGDMEIYLMDADGGNVRRITHRKGYDGGPFLSPDGKRVVYRGDPHENDLLQIFMYDLEAGRETQLTDDHHVNWGPFWHPNGRIIAFATSVHGHRNYEVYLMEVETRKLARVTYWPGNERTNGFDGLPAFSRDGTKLMWTSKRGSHATSQIWVADFHMPPELSNP